MMTKRTYHHFLQDILDNIQDAQSFFYAVTAADFYKDRMRYKAVERCFGIIGEAVKRIPKPMQSRFPEVPWSDMARLRDKIAHHYDGIDLIMLRKTVIESLPSVIAPLKAAQAVLQREVNSDWT